MMMGSKSSSVPFNPPCLQMIKEATEALNEKTRSSPYAIAKHMEEKHKAVLPANFKKMPAVQLRNFTAKGKLVKDKASFKLSSDSGKKQEKEKKSVTDKKEKKRTSSNKGLKMKKPVVVKKTERAVMAKAKQPKSIKSPAGKRARKATAA